MTIQHQEQHQQALLSLSCRQHEEGEGEEELMLRLKQQQQITDAHFVQSSSSSIHHLLDRSEHSDTSVSSLSSCLSLADADATADDFDNDSLHCCELAVHRDETTATATTTTTTFTTSRASVSLHRSILRNKNGSFSSSSSFLSSSRYSNNEQHQQRRQEEQHSTRFSLKGPDMKFFERHPVQELSNLFYDDDEIAQFQHEAWCEECGLDPKQFE